MAGSLLGSISHRCLAHTIRYQVLKKPQEVWNQNLMPVHDAGHIPKRFRIVGYSSSHISKELVRRGSISPEFLLESPIPYLGYGLDADPDS